MVASGRLGRLFAAEAIFVTSSVKVRDPRNHLFSRATAAAASSTGSASTTSTRCCG